MYNNILLLIFSVRCYYAMLMIYLYHVMQKAKKLKDQLRSSHCILKKFRKCQEDDSSSFDQVLFFFSQVDLKLVSRVLSMSKLNKEQLAWCRSKLSSIRFINRKVHVEPSVCLFPC